MRGSWQISSQYSKARGLLKRQGYKMCQNPLLVAESASFFISAVRTGKLGQGDLCCMHLMPPQQSLCKKREMAVAKAHSEPALPA